MTWNCYDSSAQHVTLLIFNIIRPIASLLQERKAQILGS